MEDVKQAVQNSHLSFEKLKASKADVTEVQEKTTELRALMNSLASNLSAANKERTTELDKIVQKVDVEVKRVEASLVRLDTRTRLNLMNLEKRRKALISRTNLSRINN